MRDLEHFSTAVANAVVVIGTIGTYVAGILPPLAAAASIFWIGWQWYHHPATVERRKVSATKRAERRKVRATKRAESKGKP